MTRIRIILAAAAAVTLVAAPALAQKSQMAGRAHDIRATGNTGDLCAGCHTAHNAATDYPPLLWNRTTTTSTFQVYDATVNPDFRGGAVSLQGGNRISLLCLSCHDGVAALNSVLNTPAGTSFQTTQVSGGARLSTDLRNDHPVAFSYDASYTALPTAYNQNPTLARVFGAAGSRRVECASCHDVHGTASDFLRAPNTNSQLCLDCHR